MGMLDNYTAMADNERRVALQSSQNALSPRVADWGIRNALELANAYQTPRNLLAALATAAYNAPGTIAGTAQSFLTGQPGGPRTKDEIYNAAGRSVNALGSAGLVAGPFAGRALQGVAASNKPAAGIKAYHGSPHDFDRFSMDKIGTGEGAQAYGHGLYFAENPKVAQDYRRQLAPTGPGTDVERFAQEVLADNKGDYSRAAAKIRDQLLKLPQNADPSIRTQGDQVLQLLESKIVQTPGRLYEVNIKADKEDFLDWDKPLSEQSDAVKKRISDWHGEEYAKSDVLTGGSFAPGPGGDLNAYVKAGIPGIKYLDQGSRGSKGLEISLDGKVISTKTGNGPGTDIAVTALAEARGDVAGAIQKLEALPSVNKYGQEALELLRGGRIKATGKNIGTYNYVVFDEKLIDITKKMGIGVPVPGGGVSLSEKQMEEVKGAMDFENKLSELESDTWDIY